MTHEEYNERVLNPINLELVQGEGCLYYWGLTQKRRILCASLDTTSVQVAKFDHLTFKQWQHETAEIEKALEAADVSWGSNHDNEDQYI